MPRAWAVLLLLPLLAHAPELASVVTANPLYFFSGLTTGVRPGVLEGLPGMTDPNAGVTTQALGRLAAEELLHGRMPWWNEYSGVGLPLAAEMQGSSLFLPFVLLLRLHDGVLYLKMAMQMLGGLATFMLLRQLGIAGRVALLGGVLYELNGTFAWLAHAPIMPVAFLPLLLFGIERARSHTLSARRGGFAWIAIAIAYSLYAGFPETAFIDGLFGAVWAAWRVTAADPAQRWRFVVKIIAGGSIGLLLAAPIALPFLEYLPLSYTGLHGAAPLGIDPASFAMALVPYLLGPIDYGGPALPWGAGGYLGVSLAYLASLALQRQRRELGLRVVLAAWILAASAKAANIPIFTALFDMIPFVHDVWFGRYAPPSCELATITLAALTLDDWHRGARFSRSALLAAAAAWTAVTAALIFQAWPAMQMVSHERPYYAIFPCLSVALAVAVAGSCAALLRARPTPRDSVLLCGLLACEALALSMFPLLCGIPPPSFDRAAIRFLQANLGLSRFYTLGPLSPNYGAFFAIASINHNYLPVARPWADYVREHLDPAADAVSFTGTYGRAGHGNETRAEALRRRLAAFAAIGVKYVLAPPGDRPFSDVVDVAGGAAPQTVSVLNAGQSVSGVVDGRGVKSGSLVEVLVVIGTYFGASDGDLAVKLCTVRQCVEGAGNLSAASDNASIAVALAAPLEVREGDTVRYMITHRNGVNRVAVYESGAGLPQMKLVYAPKAATPVPVYHDSIMSIHALADPAGYFSTRHGECVLTPLGRRKVRATCRTPATLVRQELFFPGWVARVNDKPVDIARTDQIFQSVKLPAGPAIVRFSYAPPHVEWAYGAFGAGMVALLLVCAEERPSFLKKRSKKLLSVLSNALLK